MSRTDAHRPPWTLTAADVAHLPARRRERADRERERRPRDLDGNVDVSTATGRACLFCTYDDCSLCGARTPHWYGRDLIVTPARRGARRHLRAATRVANSGGTLDCLCCELDCPDCVEDLTPPPPRLPKPGLLAHWYW